MSPKIIEYRNRLRAWLRGPVWEWFGEPKRWGAVVAAVALIAMLAVVAGGEDEAAPIEDVRAEAGQLAEGSDVAKTTEESAPTPDPSDDPEHGGGTTAGENAADPEASVDSAGDSEERMSEAALAALPPVEPEAFEVTVDPVDADWPVPTPDAVRGIYLNAWAAASSRKRAKLIALADTTEINTFVIDVKDVTGRLSYESSIPFVERIGADEQLRIRGVRAMLEELREHGIYPVARIVVFKDPYLAGKRPDWAIRHENGSVWRDADDQIWVDPYNRQVWKYNIALAREALALGFSEVQWDYVRFPDVPRRYMKTAVFRARDGRTREEAIREFLSSSREDLAEFDAPITADVFGLTVSATTDMGIGQRWASMVDATDVLLPMVYPSHFARGSYGISEPNADPYQTILTAMEHAVRRTEGVDGAAKIRPWLQDFSLGEPAYGTAEVRAQIEAVYDAGLTEWVLWNPSSDYTTGALASADGEVPDIPIEAFPEPEIDLLGTPLDADSTTEADEAGAGSGG